MTLPCSFFTKIMRWFSWCNVSKFFGVSMVYFGLKFSVNPIPPTLLLNEETCESKGICSSLHLFDAHARLLRVIRGTGSLVVGIPVVKVQTLGSAGCYTIFEEENFKGEHICITGRTGNVKLNLKPYYNATDVE